MGLEPGQYVGRVVTQVLSDPCSHRPVTGQPPLVDRLDGDPQEVGDVIDGPAGGVLSNERQVEFCDPCRHVCCLLVEVQARCHGCRAHAGVSFGSRGAGQNGQNRQNLGQVSGRGGCRVDLVGVLGRPPLLLAGVPGADVAVVGEQVEGGFEVFGGGERAALESSERVAAGEVVEAVFADPVEDGAGVVEVGVGVAHEVVDGEGVVEVVAADLFGGADGLGGDGGA